MTTVYAVINMPLMVPEIVTAVALLIFFASIKVATGYTGVPPIWWRRMRPSVCRLPICRSGPAWNPWTRPWRWRRPISTPRRWQAFRRVTLPLLWPGIMAGFMLAFVISLDDVVITEHIKSAGMETLPTYMLGQLRRSMSPEVNAVSAIFFSLSVMLVTFFFFLNRKK